MRHTRVSHWTLLTSIVRSDATAPPEFAWNSASGVHGSPTFTGAQPKAKAPRAAVRLQATKRRFMYPAPIDVRRANVEVTTTRFARYSARDDDVNSNSVQDFRGLTMIRDRRGRSVTTRSPVTLM